MRSYWGAYVAIWRAEDGTLRILRDPTGAVPCFMARVDGVLWIFSQGEDLQAVGGTQPAIDWHFVRAFLINNYSVTRFTGLSGVTEVLPGEQATFPPEGAHTFAWAWNGLSLAANREAVTFNDACARLRDTAEACLTAWSGRFDSFAVRLSGGLDSSIVLNILRRCTRKAVTAVHFVGASYEGYELALARAAAGHAGVDLIETRLDPGEVDWRQIVSAAPVLRPTKQVFGIAAEARMSEICDRIGADCIMAGHGGDAVFLQRSLAAEVLADHVARSGLGDGFLRSAYASACLQERSVWSVLNALLRPSGAAGDHPPSSPADPDAARSIPDGYLAHPWLASSSFLPPAKRRQFQSLIALANYHSVSGFGARAASVAPLISQPLLELALRTPAHLAIRGGEDRAIARCAFRDILPPAVIQRTAKGVINHRLLLILRRHLDFVRELVLDGVVAAQDWVDRPAIERMLSPEQLLRGDQLDAVLSLVAAEAWTRQWRSGR
jgi:asparagine synthase (glutamine-hydrolysing)